MTGDEAPRASVPAPAPATPPTGPALPRSRACDLIVDADAASGARNMAIDAALLETGGASDRCIVRVYRWAVPTVSLGYFQQDRTAVPTELRGLPVVRRLTGGGAILHDQELTYSCVVPASDPWRHEPSELYRRVHRAVIACLGELGFACGLRSESRGDPLSGDAADPFLCFLRADGNDVVSPEGVKVIGSAQRRRRGTILQHGSILLRASAATPHVRGIADLMPGFDVQAFRARLPSALAGVFAPQAHRRDLSQQEQTIVLHQIADSGVIE